MFQSNVGVHSEHKRFIAYYEEMHPELSNWKITPWTHPL